MAAIWKKDLTKEFLQLLGVNWANCKECKIVFLPGEPIIVETKHYADLDGPVELLRTRRFRLVDEGGERPEP